MENNTIKELEDALERILSGNPIRIKPSRKLSVSAVQAEAGLGVGSIYHYPDFVENIKTLIFNLKEDSEGNTNSKDTDVISSLRLEVKEQRRIKDKYRSELEKTKSLLQRSLLENRELAWAIHQLRESSTKNGDK